MYSLREMKVGYRNGGPERLVSVAGVVSLDFRRFRRWGFIAPTGFERSR